MIWQYLKSNIQGAASGIIYGIRGDKVSVLKNNINLLLVVNERGDKFFVKSDDICSTPILKNKEDELLSMQSPSIRKSRHKQSISRKNGK